MKLWNNKTGKKIISLSNKPASLSIIFIFTFLWLEMIMRGQNSAARFLGIGFWYVLLFFCFPPAYFAALLISFLPKMSGRIGGRVLMAVIFLIYGSQFVYYHIFSTYYTLFFAA